MDEGTICICESKQGPILGEKQGVDEIQEYDHFENSEMFMKLPHENKTTRSELVGVWMKILCQRKEM